VGDLFRRHNIRPKVIFETSNAAVIIEQVARGSGISFLTHSAVYREVLTRRVALANLEGLQLRLDIYTAVLEGHELSQPAQVFLELLQQSREDSLDNGFMLKG
jgi:DNA-binding transcriptional LysR family regulator